MRRLLLERSLGEPDYTFLPGFSILHTFPTYSHFGKDEIIFSLLHKSNSSVSSHPCLPQETQEGTNKKQWSSRQRICTKYFMTRRSSTDDLKWTKITGSMNTPSSVKLYIVYYRKYELLTDKIVYYRDVLTEIQFSLIVMSANDKTSQNNQHLHKCSVCIQCILYMYCFSVLLGIT